MEISFQTKYDLPALSALVRATLFFGKWRPIAVFYGLLTLLVLASGSFLFLLGDGVLLAVVAMATVLSMDLLTAYLYLGLPKRRYKQLTRNGEIFLHYTFRDEALEIHASTAMTEEKTVQKYASLYKILDTDQYIFLFNTPKSAYIVNKSDLKNEEVELLLSHLRSTGILYRRQH